eukprot:2433978-Alexandrium_andersonii.AAC.1
MAGWQAWLVSLKAVCRLLRAKFSRERLVATCFSEGYLQGFRHLYQSFSGQVYEERWGTVVRAVQELLPLQASLRAGWSRDRYSFGQG